MALKWNFVCLPGSGKYEGRSVRFAIDYSSLPSEPLLNNKLTTLKGFINNTKKKRVSILVNPSSITRCDLSTNLKTDDPLAEYFYNEFIKANIPKFGSYQDVQKYIRFYCFDDKGLDLPLVPNTDDLISKTGLNELKDFFGLIWFPSLLVGGSIYYFKYHKPKGKKRK